MNNSKIKSICTALAIKHGHLLDKLVSSGLNGDSLIFDEIKPKLGEGWDAVSAHALNKALTTESDYKAIIGQMCSLSVLSEEQKKKLISLQQWLKEESAIDNSVDVGDGEPAEPQFLKNAAVAFDAAKALISDVNAARMRNVAIKVGINSAPKGLKWADWDKWAKQTFQLETFAVDAVITKCYILLADKKKSREMGILATSAAQSNYFNGYSAIAQINKKAVISKKTAAAQRMIRTIIEHGYVYSALTPAQQKVVLQGGLNEKVAKITHKHINFYNTASGWKTSSPSFLPICPMSEYGPARIDADTQIKVAIGLALQLKPNTGFGTGSLYTINCEYRPLVEGRRVRWYQTDSTGTLVAYEVDAVTPRALNSEEKANFAVALTAYMDYRTKCDEIGAASIKDKIALASAVPEYTATTWGEAYGVQNYAPGAVISDNDSYLSMNFATMNCLAKGDLDKIIALNK